MLVEVRGWKEIEKWMHLTKCSPIASRRVCGVLCCDSDAIDLVGKACDAEHAKSLRTVSKLTLFGAEDRRA